MKYRYLSEMEKKGFGLSSDVIDYFDISMCLFYTEHNFLRLVSLTIDRMIPAGNWFTNDKYNVSTDYKESKSGI